METSRKCESRRAAPVGFVELRPERLALLQDVENVAQHLKHHAIGFRAHGRGPRVIIHAGHFAEEFARPEFGDGMVVRQVDRCVDRNRAPVRFVFAAVFLARGEAARELARQPREKAARAALRLHVRHGSGERDAGLAFQNIKRGRTEFAFAAHDVAALEMAPDRRVRIFLEKLRRNILENRQPEKILGRHGRPVRLPLHVFQLFKKQAGAPRGRRTPRMSGRPRQNSYNRPRLSSPSSPGRGFP